MSFNCSHRPHDRVRNDDYVFSSPAAGYLSFIYAISDKSVPLPVRTANLYAHTNLGLIPTPAHLKLKRTEVDNAACAENLLQSRDFFLRGRFSGTAALCCCPLTHEFCTQHRDPQYNDGSEPRHAGLLSSPPLALATAMGPWGPAPARSAWTCPRPDQDQGWISGEKHGRQLRRRARGTRRRRRAEHRQMQCRTRPGRHIRPRVQPSGPPCPTAATRPRRRPP